VQDRQREKEERLDLRTGDKCRKEKERIKSDLSILDSTNKEVEGYFAKNSSNGGKIFFTSYMNNIKSKINISNLICTLYTPGMHPKGKGISSPTTFEQPGGTCAHSQSHCCCC
jgi:hypothetical protein